MSTFGNPNIKNNGLVLYLDAGNTKSYSGSGITWSDLTINKLNGVLYNGPTFGRNNSIGFDGVNDYVQINHNSLLAQTYSMSFNTWIYSSNWNSLTSNYKVFSKTQTGAYAFGSSIFTVGVMEYISYIGGAYRSVTYPLSSLTNSTWYNFSGSWNSRYLVLYVNGASVSTLDYGSVIGSSSAVSYISYSFNNILAVGAEPGATSSIDGNYWPGNIALLQIYSRSLSDTEMLQNFNAIKGRFNL